MRLRTFLRAWKGASVLYIGALFGAVNLSWVGPVPERHSALGAIIHSCVKNFMSLFRKRKVNAIEQAMAFGFCHIGGSLNA